jgi:hypothetical protein
MEHLKAIIMSEISTVHTAIAVFTGKSTDHIITDKGSQSWVLDRNNALHCEYLVCCRSGINWVEGPEPQGSAFLVGRISDVVPSTEIEGRWLIKISAFARVSIPSVWQGWRNPVRYTDLASLGVDPNTLTFESMPKPVTAVQQVPASETKPASNPLTINEAKRGLALTFGVSEEAIEITIHG